MGFPWLSWPQLASLLEDYVLAKRVPSTKQQVMQHQLATGQLLSAAATGAASEIPQFMEQLEHTAEMPAQLLHQDIFTARQPPPPPPPPPPRQSPARTPAADQSATRDRQLPQGMLAMQENTRLRQVSVGLVAQPVVAKGHLWLSVGS
jgi:hypothetical protein